MLGASSQKTEELTISMQEVDKICKSTGDTASGLQQILITVQAQIDEEEALMKEMVESCVNEQQDKVQDELRALKTSSETRLHVLEQARFAHGDTHSGTNVEKALDAVEETGNQMKALEGRLAVLEGKVETVSAESTSKALRAATIPLATRIDKILEDSIKLASTKLVRLMISTNMRNCYSLRYNYVVDIICTHIHHELLSENLSTPMQGVVWKSVCFSGRSETDSDLPVN